MSPSIPTDHPLISTAYLSIVADHVHPLMNTLYPSFDENSQFQKQTPPNTFGMCLIFIEEMVSLSKKASTQQGCRHFSPKHIEIVLDSKPWINANSPVAIKAIFITISHINAYNHP